MIKSFKVLLPLVYKFVVDSIEDIDETSSVSIPIFWIVASDN